jgi:hypothetical protein
VPEQPPAVRPLPPEPDYTALGKRYTQITARLLHDPDRTWTTGSDLNAQALAELLARGDSGFSSDREHVHNLNGHTVVDRLNREDAEESARQARAETDRVRAHAATGLAAGLREWCNDRTVPAKLRREGVELAARWLDQMAAHNSARADASDQRAAGATR